MKTEVITSEGGGPVLDAFKTHINNQLLKHAAGHHIFCKYCGDILDWKTVVIFEAKNKDGVEVTVVMCNKCFNPEGVKKLEDDGYTVELTTYK